MIKLRPEEATRPEATDFKSAAESAKDPFKGFKQLGLKIAGETDSQWIADCPFSGTAAKLYVGKENGLWDSKTAGLSGGIVAFARELSAVAIESTTDRELLPLASDRGLPIEALKGAVGLNPLSGFFIIPDTDDSGEVCGATQANPGGRPVVVSGTRRGMRGAAEAAESPEGTRVWVAEGEWDWIVLRYAFQKLGLPDKAVCAPGAGGFKSSYIKAFSRRHVVVAYDNDKAGDTGSEKVAQAVAPFSLSVSRVDWGKVSGGRPPEGFDVRDLYRKVAAAGRFLQVTPPSPEEVKSFVDALESLVVAVSEGEGRPAPRSAAEKAARKAAEKSGAPAPGSPDTEDPEGDPIPAEEFEEAVRARLRMKSMDPLDVIFGTCFANKLEGEPVWMFVVAPPSGSKTELLMTLNASSNTVTTTSLTPAALVSGFDFEKEGIPDPSLLLKVNGKMLVVKDFTVLLSMQPAARDEVFSLLRDIYDGYIDKYFGNGVVKHYESRFGMLAGVTHEIDRLSGDNSSLGERFLKFRIDRFLDDEDERARIMAAFGLSGGESEWRKELRVKAALTLKRTADLHEVKFSEGARERVADLAILCSSFRAAPSWDRTRNFLVSAPQREVGVRLAKQLANLAKGVALYRGFDEVNDHCLRIAAMVAFDSVPALTAKVVKALDRIIHGRGAASATPKEVCDECGGHSATVRGTMEALAMVGALSAERSSGMETQYRFSPMVGDLMRRSDFVRA